MKNSYDGLKSQISEAYLLKKKESIPTVQLNEQSLFEGPLSSRIAPDSAHQVEREIYINSCISPAATHN